MPGGKRGESPPRPVAIDLFCGVGGMSLGFEQAGFDVVAAFDSEQRHLTTYQANFPHTKARLLDLGAASGADIRSQAGIGDGHIDIVFGGPPCQGFSYIGKRDRDDPRSRLLLDFIRLVGELQSSYFVIENVAGILATWSERRLKQFVRSAAALGYSLTEPKLLAATAFGVPQNRRRVFMVGAYRDLPLPELPATSEALNGRAGALALRPLVRDAIGDLPDIDAYPELLGTDKLSAALGAPSVYASYLRGEKKDPTDHSRNGRRRPPSLGGCLRTQHTAETLGRFRVTGQGEYEPTSRLFRLAWEGVAPTLRAGTDSSKGSFMAARPIHPEHPRCISVREAARLHSFPDWFEFHPTKWHGFRQIGNSVPPLLARGVGQLARGILYEE
jgi:DNA (cytosine-5)-methyltransferase 1